jgi:lipoprotein-releasing system ATP-binding protein
MNEPLLIARGIEKSYKMGSSVIEVLRGLDLEIAEGEVVAVVGASGIGKSTLLHILGLLDRPDRGTVHCRSENLFALSQRVRAEWRNRTFGFIFQFYHLIPELTALENVILPTMIAGSAEGGPSEGSRHPGGTGTGGAPEAPAATAFRWRAPTRGHRPGHGQRS